MGEQKIFLFGIDRAGKTALSESLKMNNIILETRPTLSFNIGNWIVDDLSFQIWYAPGQLPFRHLWKMGMDRAKVLIFCLDTADKPRFNEAYIEFRKVLNDSATHDLPLIFCLNKMDLPEAVQNLNHARSLFKLPTITDRKVVVLETSVFDKESLKKIKDTITELIMASRW